MTNTPQQLALFSENVKSDVFKKSARSKQKWAFEKSRHFGLEHCSNAFFQGKFGIVQIKKYTGDLPDKFITLDETNEIGSPSIGVVGYAYDTFLEEYVHNPEKYAYKFSKYKCLGELDFSMKILDPFGVIVSSATLSHTSAFYYQEHGCHILPTMKWSSAESYEVCFDGYEKGGAVMVSTIGVLSDERSKVYFKNGFNEMLKRISPDSVIIYGTISDWILEFMPSQLDVHHYNHERFNRMRQHGK